MPISKYMLSCCLGGGGGGLNKCCCVGGPCPDVTFGGGFVTASVNWSMCATFLLGVAPVGGRYRVCPVTHVR